MNVAPGRSWGRIAVFAAIALALAGGAIVGVTLVGSDDGRPSGGDQPKSEDPLDIVLKSGDESAVLKAAKEVADELDADVVKQVAASAASRPLTAQALVAIRDRLIEIYHQSSTDPQRRSAAVNALAPIDDDVSVQLVFRAVTTDPDADVQSEAASVLGLMTKSAHSIVSALVDALKGRPGEAFAVEEALIKIGRPALDPLIALARKPQEGQSQVEIDRISTAGYMLVRMLNESPPAIEPLLQALDARDLHLIADLIEFYISLGKPGSEGVLIEALNRFGDDVMALQFYGSGNDTLKKGAEDWARRHGRRFSGEPGGATWGRH